MNNFNKAVNSLMTVPDGIVPRLCSRNTRLSSQVTYIQLFNPLLAPTHTTIPSAISLWNSLPKSIVSAPSVQSFKYNFLSHIHNNVFLAYFSVIHNYSQGIHISLLVLYHYVYPCIFMQKSLEKRKKKK